MRGWPDRIRSTAYPVQGCFYGVNTEGSRYRQETFRGRKREGLDTTAFPDAWFAIRLFKIMTKGKGER
ncbi:MAG: hypothetical protein AVO39_03225 [delta proteobacterium MLS_D]|nr:MAG: hypothetical protein AVO39_03225 [delta proteobacterium MLS_D]